MGTLSIGLWSPSTVRQLSNLLINHYHARTNIIDEVHRTGPGSSQGFNFMCPMKGYEHHYPLTWTPTDENASQVVLMGELGISIRVEKHYLTGREYPHCHYST
ncbi:hypothetical protein Nepgr_002833 [Nepenthes gracilis]|uniref:Uncharacterized protein n=1 Tax=Nepenthes gracilis TaxID=150966 RepID=A0AAD3RY25_NEPGR|nr:hypothetical protein Nepgr_002833 [Nepenthes gracilis]